jgi:CRP-like cAMP-binding protein
LDVAFSILEKSSNNPGWIPTRGKPIELRFGLHAGDVQEGEELGGGTNIWGDGINMAARVLSVCGNSQVLVSEKYYQNYVDRARVPHMEFDSPFRRTVKHDVHVIVYNVRRGKLGVPPEEELSRRWHGIGAIWKKAVDGYLGLIDDAIHSDNPIAALTACRFALELESDAPEVSGCVTKVFSRIGESVGNSDQRLRHPVFNVMPPELLRVLVQQATPRSVRAGERVCQEGEPAHSCFFLVYGNLKIEGANVSAPIKIKQGAMFGEFSLWIPNVRRTATITAVDDSMLLEVPHALFSSLCKKNQEMSGRIRSMIKTRILTNVTESEAFFPKLGPADLDRLRNDPTTVELYPAGERLDLRDRTHILFNGKLRTRPTMLRNSTPDSVEFCASGHFGLETVVGIRTQVPGLVDGNYAEVVSDAVTVSFSHETLLEFQKRPAVRTAWHSIWGCRHGDLACRLQESAGQAGERAEAS